jgi:hypothetical protein
MTMALESSTQLVSDSGDPTLDGWSFRDDQQDLHDLSSLLGFRMPDLHEDEANASVYATGPWLIPVTDVNLSNELAAATAMALNHLPRWQPAMVCQWIGNGLRIKSAKRLR